MANGDNSDRPWYEHPAWTAAIIAMFVSVPVIAFVVHLVA